MEQLPDWEPGTVAILSVAGPHSIPVSTAIRADGRRLLFALARTRDSLARVRADERVALCMLAGGLAFTAEGRARVVREELGASPHVAALELVVDRLHDHLAGARTAILDAVSWEWTEREAADADAAVRAELLQLAAAGR